MHVAHQPGAPRPEFSICFSDDTQILIHTEPEDASLWHLVFTGAEGCVLDLDSSGQIKQIHTTQGSVICPDELSRTVLPRGTLVRQMMDGGKQLLLRDGNVSEQKIDSSDWVITNNKGIRSGSREDGSQYHLQPVAVASVTESETGAVVTTREDLVMVVMQPDGSRHVTHSDGTTIVSTAEVERNSCKRGEVVVERQGFVPVSLNLRLKESCSTTFDGTQVRWQHQSQNAS